MRGRNPIGRTLLGALAAVALVAGCTSSGSGGAASSPATTGRSTGHTDSSTSSSARPNGSTSTSRGSASPTTPSGPKGGPVPAKFTPISTTFVSPDLGWVLGTAPCSTSPCTSILRTRDGGRSWLGIPAPRANLGQPENGRNGDVSVLRFADASNGWAGVGRLYSTHDGGATWHRQHIGTSTSVVSAIQTGGGYVYATTYGCPSQGGNSCSQTSRVYASPIGRDHWTAVTPTVRGGGAPSTLVVHGRDWYLPTSAGVYHGSGLAVRSRLDVPCARMGSQPPAPHIAVADSAHLDALCVSGGAAGTTGYQLYGSTDAGRTWHKAGGSHRGPSDVTGIADNAHGVLLVAAASGDSEILRTTDDGTSFAEARISTPGGGIPWADLGFTTAAQAVVILQNSGMYLSHDSGATFSRVRF